MKGHILAGTGNHFIHRECEKSIDVLAAWPLLQTSAGKEGKLEKCVRFYLGSFKVAMLIASVFRGKNEAKLYFCHYSWAV